VIAVAERLFDISEYIQGHGRLESSQCYVQSSDLLEGNNSRRTELKSIIMIDSFRYEKGKLISLEGAIMLARKY